MSIYSKLPSSSPFIKSSRPDKYYEFFTDSENCAIDMLIAFFEDLIHYSKELKIKPIQISGLAKALHIFNHYGDITVDGSITISATDESTLPAYLKSFICTIDEDEIAISVEGFEKNDAGGDSFLNYYIRIGDHDEDYDIINSLDNWKQLFIETLNSNPGLEISDMIEVVNQ